MRYYVEKLYIKDFRKLKELEFSVGKSITVFSGHNGVGKSSLISLLSSVSGTNQKKIDNSSFQPDFDEYFKINEDENFKEYQLVVKYHTEVIQFYKRIGFRDDRATNRGIRALPRTTKKPNSSGTIKDADELLSEKLSITDSARVPIPTTYLSLSRLYPPGESEITTKKIDKRANVYQKGYDKKYTEWYNFVLPRSIDPNTEYVSTMKKKATGGSKLYIKQNDSNADTQSIGQDNLGSIITALIDFYALSQLPNYNGGILCIDEIEASFHPSALIKLFNLLNKMSHELQLQIFLTSHSLTILKEMIKLTKDNPSDYKLNYLKGTRIPNVVDFLSYDQLKADLFSETQSIEPVLKIYCEDESTKNLFELIIDTFHINNDFSGLKKHEIIPVFLGCDQLIQMPRYDNYFSKIAIVLDGDAKIKNKENKIKIENYIKDKTITKGLSSIKLSSNIITLPGFLSPEGYIYSIIHDYAHNDNDHFKFWRSLDNNVDTLLYTSDKIIETLLLPDNELNLTKLKGISAKLFKFAKETQILEDYYKNNPQEHEQFIKAVNKSFYSVSNKLKSDRL